MIILNWWEIIGDHTWITAIGGVIGSIITYLITRNNNNKDIYLNDRENLSEGQTLLMQELRDMMTEQKTQIREQKDEIAILRLEIKKLQENNINLLIENRQLSEKITELSNRLNELKD